MRGPPSRLQREFDNLPYTAINQHAQPVPFDLAAVQPRPSRPLALVRVDLLNLWAGMIMDVISLAACSGMRAGQRSELATLHYRGTEITRSIVSDGMQAIRQHDQCATDLTSIARPVIWLCGMEKASI